MINKDKIFEMLGVEVGESFYIEEEIIKHTYHFDTDFFLWQHKDGSKLSSAYSLLDFLNGNYHIKKIIIRTMTPSEKIVLEYAKLCGGKYIAKDEDGSIYFYAYVVQ